MSTHLPEIATNISPLFFAMIGFVRTKLDSHTKATLFIHVYPGSGKNLYPRIIIYCELESTLSVLQSALLFLFLKFPDSIN